jgi:hypothetical protein
LPQGQQYWQQERRICSQLAGTQPGHDVTLTQADIVAAHESKSFDYRVGAAPAAACAQRLHKPMRCWAAVVHLLLLLTRATTCFVQELHLLLHGLLCKPLDEALLASSSGMRLSG